MIHESHIHMSKLGQYNHATLSTEHLYEKKNAVIIDSREIY